MNRLNPEQHVPSDTVVMELPVIEFNNRQFETNLPGGKQSLNLEPNSSMPRIVPAVLDEIPDGQYRITEILGDDPYINEDGSPQKPEEKHIQLFEAGGRRYVTLDSFDSGTIANTLTLRVPPGIGNLLGNLGYAIEHEDETTTIKALPTPASLKKSAADIGVEIELIDDYTLIPGKRFVEAFADGKYPVSTAGETYYIHDIGDDHITAMALGGEPLRDALAMVAKEALQKGGDSVKTLAAGIDSFTATLRAVVTTNPLILGEAYGEDAGRRTFLSHARELGIPDETAAQILKTAQETAEKLGIELTRLK